MAKYEIHKYVHHAPQAKIQQGLYYIIWCSMIFWLWCVWLEKKKQDTLDSTHHIDSQTTYSLT